jgi:hypothetical protein
VINNDLSKRDSRRAYARELLRELSTVERLCAKYRSGSLQRRLENKRQAIMASLMVALR